MARRGKRDSWRSCSLTQPYGEPVAHAPTHANVRYTCTRQPDNAFRTVSRIGSTSYQNCLIVCHTNSPEFSLLVSSIFEQPDRRISFFEKKRIERQGFFFLQIINNFGNFRSSLESGKLDLS